MNKLLIFAVLIAALIIGGSVMLAKRSSAPDGPEAPKITFDGEKVMAPEFYQTCAKGERCIVVDTHCGFCCKYTAINARYEEDFNKTFDKNCRRFTGNFCQCFDLSSYPSCVNGKCQLVAWPDDASFKEPSPEKAKQRSSPAPEPDPVYTPPPQPAPAYQPPVQQPPQPAYETPEDGFEGFGDNDNSELYDTPDPSQEPASNDFLYEPLPQEMPKHIPQYQDPNDPLNKPLPAGKL